MLKNFLHWGFRRKSARVMANGSFFLTSSATASTTLTACAKTVAMAAPAAVAKASKDGREQVIRNDEENSAAADAHIARRETDGLLRRLHQNRDRPGKAHEQDKYPDG